MILVKYFGAIAEQTESNNEEFSFSEISLQQLLTTLEEKYELGEFSFSVSINQKIVQNTADYILKSNDIIALLPPFAGG